LQKLRDEVKKLTEEVRRIQGDYLWKSLPVKRRLPLWWERI
jgi:hypothetical protein